MLSEEKSRLRRVKLIGVTLWSVLGLIAVVLAIVALNYVAIILVVLVYIGALVAVSSGIWQWSNSRPHGFFDWLRR